MSQTFFDRVVAATKLTPLLAPFVVQRICVSRGVIATELRPETLDRILPALVDAVAKYLDPAKVPEMSEALKQLAQRPPDTR